MTQITNNNNNKEDEDETVFSVFEFLPASIMIPLEQDTYDLIEGVVQEQPILFMHERLQERITEEVAPVMFDLLLSVLEMDELDDVEYEDVVDFVQERVDVYLKSMCDVPRSYERDQNIYTSFVPVKAKMDTLCTVYQPPQRTQEWYEFRHNVLTASEIGNILGTESSMNRVMYEKCCPLLVDTSTYVNVNSPMHWGQKYEPVTLMVYERNYETHVREFGCIRHPTYPCIAASPDGINMDENSPKYGRMVEIKNIVNREITGIPMTKYWIQMQIQMEVCDLEVCDFVETRFKEYTNWTEMLEDTRTVSKGVILYFVRKHDPYGNPHYVYMPLHIPLRKESVMEWIEQQQNGLSELYMLQQTLAWYLDEISCVVVPRHHAWFAAVCPKLLETWNTIEKERVEGYAHREPAKSKPKVRSNKLMVDVTKLA